MAKKGSGLRSSASPAWRILMPVYAVIFFMLLPLYEVRTLEFLYPRLMDMVGVSDYTLSFIVAGAWIVGLALITFAPASKRWLLALGLVLFLTPVWLIGEPKANNREAWAYAGLPTDLLKLVCAAALALWALVPVRGEAKAGLKGALAAALIALDALCYVNGSKPLDWAEIDLVMCLALITGFFADMALNGFSAGAFTPAAVCGLKLALVSYCGRPLSLWVTLGLAAAAAITLAWKKPKGSLGGVFSLTGLAVNTALMLTKL